MSVVSSLSSRLCLASRASNRSTRSPMGARTSTRRWARGARSWAAISNTRASSARSAADHHSWSGPWSSTWTPGRRRARATACRTVRRFAGRASRSRRSCCLLPSATPVTTRAELASRTPDTAAPSFRATREKRGASGPSGAMTSVVGTPRNRSCATTARASVDFPAPGRPQNSTTYPTEAPIRVGTRSLGGSRSAPCLAVESHRSLPGRRASR